jgi:hypothetical protein
MRCDGLCDNPSGADQGFSGSEFPLRSNPFALNLLAHFDSYDSGFAKKNLMARICLSSSLFTPHQGIQQHLRHIRHLRGINLNIWCMSRVANTSNCSSDRDGITILASALVPRQYFVDENSKIEDLVPYFGRPPS